MKKMLKLSMTIMISLLFIGCNSLETANKTNSSNNVKPSTPTPEASTEDSSSSQDKLEQSSAPTLSPETNKMLITSYNDWDMEQLKLNNKDFVNYYSLHRDNSDTLLIYLDGSGCQSVLGIKNGDIWTSVGNAYGFAYGPFPEYDFLTLDKVNITAGGDHSNDKAVMDNYTFDIRVKSTVAVIDEFLKDKKYKDVVIFGISEGGFILPKVYSLLEQKEKVTKLIVLGEGGLSQYEEFKILGASKLQMNQSDKEEYAQVEKTYKDILKYPDSIDKQYFGLPYKRWYGFFTYSPIEDYLSIDIPILLQHGSLDTSSAVEAARLVKEEFTKKGKNNLKYIEYAEMGHGPIDIEQSNQVFGDIINWLMEK